MQRNILSTSRLWGTDSEIVTRISQARWEDTRVAPYPTESCSSSGTKGRSCTTCFIPSRPSKHDLQEMVCIVRKYANTVIKIFGTDKYSRLGECLANVSVLYSNCSPPFHSTCNQIVQKMPSGSYPSRRCRSWPSPRVCTAADTRCCTPTAPSGFDLTRARCSQGKRDSDIKDSSCP